MSVADIQQITRRRGKASKRGRRGLPRTKELRSLAKTYLTRQRSLWPELAKQKCVPPATKENIQAFAKEFKNRFLRKRVVPFCDIPTRAPWADMGISYLRYSDDNSNPRSLDQQLKLQLDRARDLRVFIPWNYVFADARVTGTTAHRRGYKLAKRVLRDDPNAGTLFVDELGRASRDMIETLFLGRLVRRLKKRLLGVSDAFDLSSPMGTMLLSIFAGLHQWFIEQLRAKVNRGMNDAFDLLANLGIAAIGYKLVPLFDKEKRKVLGKDGEQRNTLAKDQPAATWILAAFILYGLREWSRDQIAELFNQQKVGGYDRWDSSRVKQILTRWKYVGIITYRMTYKEIIERGKNRGKIKIRHRPRREWRAIRARHLQIVPRWLWKLVKRRLAKVGEAYAKDRNGDATSRKELYHRELFRPICGCCGHLMDYGHSGQYPSWVCLNGKVGKHGCTFKGYKSVRIVDTAILDYLGKEVLTPERIEACISAANQYLAQRAEQVVDDGEATRIEAEIRQTIGKRDRLIELIEGGDGRGDSDQDGADLESVRRRIRAHEQTLKELRSRLASVTQKSVKPPQPIDRAAAAAMLQDLRGLLSHDVKAAAPVLRKLTGPIRIEQKQEPGHKKPTWIAKFTVNLVPVMLHLERQKESPNAGVWEYLQTANWIVPIECKVPLEGNYKYRTMADEIIKLADAGVSINEIASAKGISWETAKAILAAARDGGKPQWKKPGQRTGVRKDIVPKWKEIAEDVLRLKKDEKTWGEIRTWLHKHRGISASYNTLRTAWDRANQRKVAEAAKAGQKPEGRSSHSKLGEEKKNQIRVLLQSHTPADVARIVGCSIQSVYRERKAG